MQAELTVTTDDGVCLAVEQAGEGPPIVLLHGLTATRRYVVMGSRLLERSGHRVISYDARGHGRSTPAVVGPPATGAVGGAAGPADGCSGRGEGLIGAYGYPRLARDLEAVLDALEIETAALAGASMGAHTILRFALEHPRRVAALGVITPAFDGVGEGEGKGEGLARWDALARGLRTGGVEGFLGAYDLSTVPERWRETIEKVIRQRLAGHLHLDAVADALEAVPRSRPFESFAQLSRTSVPTLVVASRDKADPGHPLAVGERYAHAIPGAKLLVEAEGSSPIAWQGGQLSKALLELVG